MDNIRFLLIFCVVFAHFLEVCEPFFGSRMLYKIIYTFHMPAFIFLFGYNVKYSVKRIVYRWCIPYVVFQSIYIIFSIYVLKNGTEFQYTKPYWLLWYMLACIYFQLLLPIYDTEDKRLQAVSVACTFVISLLIGFDDSVGYNMSLSRFFVFQPWFLLGYYCKKNNVFESLSACKKFRNIIVSISAVIIMLSVPFIRYTNLSSYLLYGSYSYSKEGVTLFLRLSAHLIAFVWIVFLFIGIKPLLNRRFVVLTRIGQATLSVFLMHGFFVKAIPVYFPSLLSSPVKVILLSFGILVFFGNKLWNKAVYYIGFSWFENISYFKERENTAQIETK